MEIKCGADGCLHGIEGLEACAPIPVSLDDADFAVYNRCLKFVRNLEVPNINCEPGNSALIKHSSICVLLGYLQVDFPGVDPARTHTMTDVNQMFICALVQKK